ncbi:MAG: RES domain-containing protein [Bacteroidales bacterium]
MEIDFFPKHQDVINSICKIKETNFPKFEVNTDVESHLSLIEGILTKEFGFLVNYLVPFKHDRFSLNFFRARKLIDFQNISLIREHSYPPINATKMGRCNFPMHPVFYCSDNSITALLEASHNSNTVGNKFCISKWELSGSEDTLLFQNFLQTQLPPENQFRLLQKGFVERINEPFRRSLNEELDEDRRNGLFEYIKFLDSSFINDKDYSLSATLAHRALYCEYNYRADVLMYPSVQTDLKGVNMALSPNFVENNLKMTRLYVVTLNKYESVKSEVNISITKYAEVEKNIVMWKKISPENEDYKNLISEDFGEMVGGSLDEL